MSNPIIIFFSIIGFLLFVAFIQLIFTYCFSSPAQNARGKLTRALVTGEKIDEIEELTKNEGI